MHVAGTGLSTIQLTRSEVSVNNPVLMTSPLNLAATISARPMLSIEVIKEQFRVLSKTYSITPSAFKRVQGMRRKVYDSHDYEEAITAFLEKRPANFKGK